MIRCGTDQQGVNLLIVEKVKSVLESYTCTRSLVLKEVGNVCVGVKYLFLVICFGNRMEVSIVSE